MSKDASGTSSYERSYKYAYDGINRYTASSYAERTTAGTGAFNNNIGGFDESAITYDGNGNITGLKRNSSTQGTNTHIQIDSLIYTYDTNNPDQLQKVTDGTGANYTGAGFRNLTGSTGNYTYDGNGNLAADPYKGLTLAYDVLNRTDKITVTTSTNRFIYYTYNASGTLIRKQQYDNNVLQNTTDYLDGFVYTTVSSTQTLQYFAMPEGRVINVSGTLKREFILSDQQGNARVSFQDNGSGAAIVKQENSYYAFGLVLLNSPVTTPTPPNKQLYNGGSEWQNDYSNLPDYYQTFNRNYDAALGRWIGVDPSAEGAESMSSYQYAGNNPVMYNDPLGDLLSPPGAHTAPYTPWRPLDLGGPPDDIQQNQSNFFGAGGGGGGDVFNGSGDPNDPSSSYYGNTTGTDSGDGNSGGGLTDAQWLFVTTIYNNGPIEANYNLDHQSGLFRPITTASAFAIAAQEETQFGQWGQNGVASSLNAAIYSYDANPNRKGPGITTSGTLYSEHSDQSNQMENGSPVEWNLKEGGYSILIDGVNASGSFPEIVVDGAEKGLDILDHGAVYTDALGFALKNSGWVETGAKAFKYLGGATDIVIIGTDFYKSYQAFKSGNVGAGLWQLAKAGGTGAFLYFGGAEYEGLKAVFNLGTAIIDDSNK